MVRRPWLHLAVFVWVAGAGACVGASPLYPPRPPAVPGPPIAEPTPSRIVVHTTIGSAGLVEALNQQVPTTGEGTTPILRQQRRFTWKRDAFRVRFDRGRIGLDVHVLASVEAPITHLEFPLDIQVLAEPVISATYAARLQSLEVKVTSTDARLRMADAFAGVLAKIQNAVQEQLQQFAYDIKPMLAEVYGRVDAPIPLPLGGANGCAELRVLGVEAGPTVLADGIEKDFALVVAPQVTLPCTPAPRAEHGALPPLANVATLQGGPFSVTVPIAAHYDELAKAMGMAFTDGKLFFSKDYPELYMEDPEVYAAKDELVLKLHIAGSIKKMFLDTDMSGDIFMTGHPMVIDNEIRVSDLEPTVETKNVLLKLKATLDGNEIRDQARAALRLDLGERLTSVRDKLSKDLAFGDGKACVRANADKIEIAGVHVHGAYLRVYVSVTGRSALFMPCLDSKGPASSPPEAS